MAGFKFYHYDPSFPAAVAFVVLFSGVSVRHIQLLFKHRAWYFIPFLIGCLFEAFGHVGRAIGAKQTPDWTLNPYLLQSLLTLLGPTLFAAAIYMVLGRLIRLLGAEAYSMIRPKWLTKFFLLGDLLSFFSQSGGGGILATAKTESSQNLGNKIILLGLGIQVIFFGFFIVVTIVFHARINRRPTTKSYAIVTPWKKLIWVLYLSSLLIMVRSIFRMIEYAEGNDGELMQKEIYVYALDSALMCIVGVLFAICHPSSVLVGHTVLDNESSLPHNTDSYAMLNRNRVGTTQ
ncbi:RTA1 like protein-domain-containing protein [Dactylonectria estremocensis]|uniref:RTA1 like protein-domain-containing protein n=1 Tax=Dactylonectria estremocensis TaxID=1079267 RepID=A0A9P9ERL6_9HYPO|nr:RTA1 like protein-domain-containing protein [Dactylonectria estremocensis]